jgi:hypothetical protein
MFVRAKLIGVAAARAKIRAIGPVVHKTSRELLTQEARLVAISCAKSSQPFGTGEISQKLGQFRVAADIYKVYTTVGKAYEDIAKKNERAAKAFWAALNHGDFARAQGILRRDGSSLRHVPLGTFDDGALHMRRRNSRTGRVAASQRPLMIVRNKKQLETYIRKRQANVGLGKSAWVTIARLLVSSGAVRGLRTGGDITANWISRHRGSGDVTWTGDEQNLVVTLTSRVTYASQILPTSAMSLAVSIARNRLHQSMRIAYRAELRAAGLAA